MLRLGIDNKRTYLDASIDISPEYVFLADAVLFVEKEGVSYDNGLPQTSQTSADDIHIDFLIAMRHEEQAITSYVVLEAGVNDAVKFAKCLGIVRVEDRVEANAIVYRKFLAERRLNGELLQRRQCA